MALGSLLVIAERSGETLAALQRAAVIARHAGAKIELFTCDTDHAWALGEYAHSAEARAAIEQCMVESRRYLEALRGSISAADVQIDTRCACALSLHEGIAVRIESLQPQLVVKSLEGAGLLRPPLPLEMQLVQGCTAPLLLTHGVPWRPAPRIGAALDLAEPQLPRAQAVAAFAAGLAADCAGRLHCGFVGARLLPAALQQLDLQGAELERLSGSTGEALRAWVDARQLDVLVLGALVGPQERGISLAERLLGELPCDIIIVPPPPRPEARVPFDAPAH
jgi:nucleotide-binding universal stress UspA family protein